MSKPDWSYVNSINEKDKYIDINDAGSPKYLAFLINKSLCNHRDTVLYANVMNINYGLDNKLQYDFLYHGIRQKRRIFKNRKTEKSSDDSFTLVQSYYGFNNKKTYEALNVLTHEQIEVIRRKMDKGGVK